MNMRQPLIGAAAMLLGMGTMAKADVLASSPAHGSTAQKVAVCYVFNSGAGNLSISDVQVIKEPSGASATLITKNCPAAIGPGGICRSVFSIGANDVVACRATLSPKASARASLEIRDSGNNAINSRDLR